ncbi:MAG: hypothetical protein ACRC4W_07230, partial [Treponemataceae bacterium]
MNSFVKSDFLLHNRQKNPRLDEYGEWIFHSTKHPTSIKNDEFIYIKPAYSTSQQKTDFSEGSQLAPSFTIGQCKENIAEPQPFDTPYDILDDSSITDPVIIDGVPKIEFRRVEQEAKSIDSTEVSEPAEPVVIKDLINDEIASTDFENVEQGLDDCEMDELQLDEHNFKQKLIRSSTDKVIEQLFQKEADLVHEQQINFDNSLYNSFLTEYTDIVEDEMVSESVADSLHHSGSSEFNLHEDFPPFADPSEAIPTNELISFNDGLTASASFDPFPSDVAHQDDGIPVVHEKTVKMQEDVSLEFDEQKLDVGRKISNVEMRQFNETLHSGNDRMIAIDIPSTTASSYTDQTT